MTPTIIIVTYNRPESFKRIISSVMRADYSGYSDIRLIISIDDADSHPAIKKMAEAFIWPYGVKQVIKHGYKQGLRKHILGCGDLTKTYGSVIILEDDCFVSQNFYRFAAQALGYYNSDVRIAGISLYSHRFNENAFLPFVPIFDGNDVFFMQVPTSLGQVWTQYHWHKFREYYNRGQSLSSGDMLPQNVKDWPESSWKKYFYRYIVENDLYFVYPSVSYLTNFGDSGTHYTQPTSLHQVPIERHCPEKSFKFIPFDTSWNKYDGFFELLPESFQISDSGIGSNCIIDLYGTKPLEKYEHPYALSIKDCSKPQRTFGNSLFPISLNIMYDISGTEIRYARREHFTSISSQSRWRMIRNLQPLGYSHGMNSVLSSNYYKIGFYLLNPSKIFGFLRRKLKRFCSFDKTV